MNPPYKLLNYGLLLQQATLVDIKLTNVDKNAVGGLIVVDDIATHLSKLSKNSRTVGVPYTMLVPKTGYVPLPGYTPAQYQLAVANFDIKYYTFKDGVEDINFVEIECCITFDDTDDIVITVVDKVASAVTVGWTGRFCDCLGNTVDVSNGLVKHYWTPEEVPYTLTVINGYID